MKKYIFILFVLTGSSSWAEISGDLLVQSFSNEDVPFTCQIYGSKLDERKFAAWFRGPIEKEIMATNELDAAKKAVTSYGHSIFTARRGNESKKVILIQFNESYVEVDSVECLEASPL